MYCFAFLLFSFSFMVACVNDQCYSDGQPIPKNVGLSLLTCPSTCQIFGKKKRLQEMAIGQLPQFEQPFQLFQTMVNLSRGWSSRPIIVGQLFQQLVNYTHCCGPTILEYAQPIPHLVNLSQLFPTLRQFSELWVNLSREYSTCPKGWSTCPTLCQLF